MTKKCPTCGGDGIVVSEETAALDVERRLRALAAGSRSQAYRVEVAAKIASLLVGPGAERLVELEAQVRRRFFLVGKDGVHLDHFLVLAEGKRDDLAVEGPVDEGAEVELKLGEVGLYDAQAGVGKLDGYDVYVADAAKLVGKKVKVHVERVLDGIAYATLADAQKPDEAPITAEREAEKPTRTSVRKPAPKVEGEATEAATPKKTAPKAKGETTEEATPKKKTRRGSRGGRGRKRKTTTTAASASGNGAGESQQVAKIHVPDPALGEEAADEATVSEDGAEEPKAKRKTRRGSRGGRNRRKKTTGGADQTEAPPEWEYVPMSEWEDDVLSE
jgi:predicted RNA-binding protein with TRAM domain